MAPRLQCDFETRSACDLTTAGAVRYSLHPSTQITHLGWAFDNDPVQVWVPGEPFPQRVLDHVAAGGITVWHNAGFDRRIWNHVLKNYVNNLHMLYAQQQSCTMSRALVLSYPDDLELLCQVLGITQQKDTGGGKLMKTYCKAFTIGPNGLVQFKEPPPDIAARITEYCRRDVQAQREVDRMLPELSAREREIWLLDQAINDRGIPIDLKEIECAQSLARYAQAMVNAEVRELTGGYVQKVTESAKVVEWFNGRGMATKSARAFDLAQVDASLHPNAERIIDLRVNGAKSSVAKFGKMLGAHVDSRLRDNYAYHKAVPTGRPTGRGVQVMNFKRLDKKADFSALFEAFGLFGMDAERAYWYVHLVTGASVLPHLASSMRRFVKAPKGKTFYGGDFSQIENRYNAWIAGEEWKLQAFRDFDAGAGPDLYQVSYSRSFGVPLADVTDDQRQIGKAQELMFGYQGGVGAFLRMGPQYQVRPGTVLPVVKVATSPDVWSDFARQYPTARDKHALEIEPWIAIKVLIRNFRLQNARIAQSWYNLQQAAVQAVERPDTPVEIPDYRGCKYLCTDNMLYGSLPSGRLIAYAQPSVVEDADDSIVWQNGLVEDAATYTQTDIDTLEELGIAKLVRRRPRKQVQFWEKYQTKWVRSRLYGGLQCNHFVQGSCRDIQEDAKLRLAAAGYPIVLHTYDDICAECGEGHGDEAEFRATMGRAVEWAPGLPIAVKTWMGGRYGD